MDSFKIYVFFFQNLHIEFGGGVQIYIFLIRDPLFRSMTDNIRYISENFQLPKTSSWFAERV